MILSAGDVFFDHDIFCSSGFHLHFERSQSVAVSLISGHEIDGYSTMREIANKLKMDRSHLARTLQLANCGGAFSLSHTVKQKNKRYSPAQTVDEAKI